MNIGDELIVRRYVDDPAGFDALAEFVKSRIPPHYGYEDAGDRRRREQAERVSALFRAMYEHCRETIR